jgi:hypothetical protein
MGNYRQTGDDLNAAALFGCREAQFWSIFSSKPTEKSIDENEN